MNSTPTPKAVEPDKAPIGLADEQLARAHEEIERADKDLERLTEQVARMERDAARRPGSRLLSKRRVLWALVALPLAAIIVAALVLRSSYEDPAKRVYAQAPQSPSTPSLPPENTPLASLPAHINQVAAAEPAPPQVTPLPKTPPEETASKTTAPLSDQTQLLQTMARDLANMERTIEQLKASLQQTTSDSSKAIEELKASQEEIKRMLAKVSEQTPAKTSSPPTKPATTLRTLERMVHSSPPRARRIPREWFYDEW